SGRSGNIAMAPERIALRRHANTCCGLTSCARATAETFAPGVIASSSIRAFASSDQRRRGTAGLASRRFGTASMTANVPCLDLGADCKQTSRENHHESVAAFINPQNTGSAWRLHMSDGSGSILLLWNNLLPIQRMSRYARGPSAACRIGEGAASLWQKNLRLPTTLTA